MMPIMNDQSERPGCVPTLKDEPFLPSIKSVSPTKSDRGHGFHHNNNNKENKSRNHNDNHTSSHQDVYSASLKPYYSAPASESSTPFKLPTIDRSESQSVASLISDKHGRKGMGRSRERRSRLCRSPSCPSLAYWGDHPESPRSTRFNKESTEHPDAHVRPFFTHREEEGVKLPSIFGRKNANTSFTLTSSTANSSAHTSRDTSPFNFKREATFLNLSQHDHSTDGPTTRVVSPQHTYVEGDSMSRSSTQSSALLLPISSCHESQNASKIKRKRKKQSGMLISSEMGSEAEKLLREKLGAIERRDFERPSPTHNHETEKTDLSDTAFIDKVQDETTIANGASEPLTSQPAIYQNTPTRIKTEKKITPVKA